MNQQKNTPWVVGNWKQNPKTPDEVRLLIDGLLDLGLKNCHIAIAPSTLHLPLVVGRLPTSVMVVGQDVCATNGDVGAYTGDVSAAQLAACGATWVIVGHSERRTYHNEDNATLTQKINYASLANLGVVLCVGESREAYNTGKTQLVLKEQLLVLQDVDMKSKNLLVAYEPVWAIGTGLTPTVTEIETAHQLIKTTVAQYGFGDDTPVLYGGSVNDKNVSDFAKSPHINGVLVGGASLKPNSFRKIIDSFASNQYSFNL